jgi:dihydrofolate synthase/folylpolyglutamate synthase
MTYDEAIRFWYGRINYEVRAARPEDLKLERMREFLRRLGNPQNELRVVHITGTKGKGSTAAMIASIAQAAGHKAGLFTSPHLVKVEERIQVNGVPIPEADLAALMTRVKPVIEAMDAGPYSPLTFFEIVTALGWLHFQEQRVDLAVMEVGLGGRFDSTNVCSPLVTVITSIGYDHMAQLGDTLEKIAYQKAGIIKKGVPCVIGQILPGPRDVIHRIAAKFQAPLREFGRDFHPTMRRINLLGEHQETNAAIAVEAVQEWKTKNMATAIQEGLTSVVWPARIEVIGSDPDPVVILDCAHNVPSIEALVRTLRSEFPEEKAKTCIFAVSSDKQYREMLVILASYFERFIFTKYGNNPRCVPPEYLATLLPETISRTVITPAIRAVETARRQAKPFDLICITGSVFLAGELRQALTNSK